ncbi:DUF2007 domain-containing protein [Nibrella saemangeumensis]
MFENWEKVLTTPMPYRAELAKAILAENEIDAVVLNKQSSSYPPFGNCEVYVPIKQAIIAKVILDMGLLEVEAEE